MSQPVTTAPLGPDALFVVACPVCRGHVAATGSLCGRDACCPLCASLFHVPVPRTGPTMADTRSSVGEDWDGVLRQLEPPGKDHEVEPATAAREPEDFELPALGPIAEAADQAGTEQLNAGTTVADFRPENEPPSDLLPQPLRETTAGDDGASDGSRIPASAPPDGLPITRPAPLHLAPTELRFQEPVRTVRHGNTVIEIRRLTPEERQARRLRRNLMMIVVGVSILLLIVLLNLPKPAPSKQPRSQPAAPETRSP